MPKFYSKDLAQLAHQISLSPRRLRVGQLRAIESLLGIIDVNKAYPFDFVCYRITKYHKRGLPNDAAIPGKALIADLVTMAEVCSRKAAIAVAELGESYKTHSQLAEALNVSTKTVRRWRTRGLLGLRAVCEDGVNRLVFCEGTIDRFAEAHGDLIARGAAFKQLSTAERTAIVRRARELAGERRIKLHAAAKTIAAETGRAVETVRYTLRRYDAGAGKKAIFARDGGPVHCPRESDAWARHQAGDSAAEIAQVLGRSVREVEQMLRTVQVRIWQQDPPVCIYNELFDAVDADQIIMHAPPPEAPDTPLPKAPKDLPPYLRSLYAVPLLTRDQEQDLFRRFNYLKFKAGRRLKAVDPDRITAEGFNGLRLVMSQIDELRRQIIRANLRLVVAVARKHVGWSPAFFEVVSDGNMSLMRAVEKFDYARGTKFGTYATWAIMKNYARSIPEQHYHYTRYVTGQEGILDAVAEPADGSYASDRRHVRALIEAGINELPRREREIVSKHFGLGAKGKTQTLEQLGRRFGITKERVRQIEQKALAQLRETLAPSLAEALH